jgi:hypothetical protein
MARARIWLATALCCAVAPAMAQQALYCVNWQSTDMLPRVESPTLPAPSRQCWDANRGSLREAGNAAQELFFWTGWRNAMHSAMTRVALPFAAALFAAIPISPQPTPTGLELSLARAQAAIHRYHRRVHRKVYPQAYLGTYQWLILPTNIYT